MTSAELSRWVEKHERQHADLVSRREFELTARNQADDIAEIKEAQKWQTRLILSTLIGLVVQIVIIVINTVGVQ